MKHRFGHGQAPSGNPLRRKRCAGRLLTDRERELCARCNGLRWNHEKGYGLIADHEFEPRAVAQVRNTGV